MNKITFVCLLFALSLFSCAKKISSYSITNIEQLELKKSLRQIYTCNDPLNYVPDSLTRLKYIRVNVHLMDDSTGQKNFTLQEGKKFMNALLSNANKRLGDNKKMNLPVGNNTPNMEPHYRYKVVAATDDPNDDGYYKHKDNELYYFLNKGKFKNNYKREVLKKYNIGSDSIINIFILPHHPDSVKSKTYKPHRTGIALGTDLKMAGMVEGPNKPWEYATLLNHEIGHILGLSHSWVRNDRCDDTPSHPNCWDKNSGPPCDGTHSNNMMDYNNSQMAITPCQLGIVHKGFSKLKHKNRGLIEVDWCEKDDSKEIIIQDSILWTGSKDLLHDIRILPGAVLEIQCRISMSKGSKFIVEPGGSLILKGCLIHNACEEEWNGFEIQSKGKDVGTIEAFGRVRLENLRKELLKKGS